MVVSRAQSGAKDPLVVPKTATFDTEEEEKAPGMQSASNIQQNVKPLHSPSGKSSENSENNGGAFSN